MAPCSLHAAEYLPHLAMAAYPGKTDKPKREQWLHDHRHRLKHESGAVDTLIKEAERLMNKRSLGKTVKDNLQAALTYFTNQRARMDYPAHLAEHLPIGSGVIEAACKTLVKQRLCGAGMRWKHQGAKIVLSLRALVQSSGRWAQFWNKIDQFGAQPKIGGCLAGHRRQVAPAHLVESFPQHCRLVRSVRVLPVWGD